MAAGSKEGIHVASNRSRETIDVRVILAKMTRQRGRPVFTGGDQTFIVVLGESEANVASIQEKVRNRWGRDDLSLVTANGLPLVDEEGTRGKYTRH